MTARFEVIDTTGATGYFINQGYDSYEDTRAEINFYCEENDADFRDFEINEIEMED